jgi:predicted DNA-binding transcriptional regulator AlpA
MSVCTCIGDRRNPTCEAHMGFRRRSTATIDRVAIARDATEIEAAGGEWTVRHVMAILGIARSTVYDTAWLIARARRIGKRGLRWNPADVRNARHARPQSIRSAS